MALSFSLAHFCFIVSWAGNDFLSKWSLANPFIVESIIGLMQSEKTSVMSIVKHLGTHIWQINWQIYPPVDLPVDLNGNFRFLLFKLILADQLADLPPGRSASGSEWQFHISTIRADIGRSNRL